MELLRGTRVYLAGPVECVDDNATWREILRPILGSMEIVVWDPLIKPKWFMDQCGCELTAEEQRQDLHLLEKYSRSKNCPLVLSEITKALERNSIVRDTCLRLASSCDFAICHVGDKTVGTFEEIAMMNNQGKPIIFLHASGKLDSCWRHTQFKNAIHKFSIDEVVEYLNNINNGFEKVDNKDWIFLPGRWPNASSSTTRSDQ